jgi:hypothetical protein
MTAKARLRDRLVSASGEGKQAPLAKMKISCII